jgi:class 3 adenylate cyclase/tetratricopeptide (TPR) repeat protein
VSPTRNQAPRAGRRVTTVLIADLVGYSTLAEQLDPEDLDRIMKRVIEGETRIVVEEYGGTVFGSDGDDVKALFGHPIAHEDDPCRAVRCAKALRDFALRVSAEFPELAGRPLELHAAVSTGLVVAARDDAGRTVPTGDAVNTAARLVHAAQPGEIVVEATTMLGIAEHFATEPLGSLTLRGKRLAVEAYRVLDPIPRKWFELPQERGLSPFVGRRDALASLEVALGDARCAKRRFVAVIGEAGVGKSRLLYEFHQAIGEEVRVVVGECNATGRTTPYHPFAMVVRELLGVDNAVSAEARRERVSVATADLDPGLSVHVPMYLQLLSLRAEGEPLPPHLHGERIRQAMLDAVTALVTAAAREPLIVLLEDWHLADSDSRSLLDRIALDVSDCALLLVVTHRREGGSASTTTAPVTLLLEPLGVDDAQEIVAARLGAGAVSRGFVHRLHEHTGGNPLFLDEICRSMIEGGTVTAPISSFDAVAAPSTVQAVIRARIDGLEPHESRTARLASVLGQVFSRSLLRAVADELEDRVDAALDRLTDSGLLVEFGETRDSDRRYRFKHMIVCEVAYETLLHEDRRHLHRRAGAAMEKLYPPDTLRTHDELLTLHYERGGDIERAAYFAQRAGDKAAATFSLGPARDWYVRAIRLLDQLGDDPELARRRIDISGKWSETGVYDPRNIDIGILQRSSDLAQVIGDQRRAARSVYWMGWFEHTRGNHHAAGRHFRSALELSEALDDRRLVPQLRANLGQTFYHRAELALARSRLERVVRARERSIVAANALGYLALVDAETGDFAAARTRSGEALAIVRELGQRQLEGSILTMVTFVDLFQGAWGRCERHAAEMRAIAGEIGAPYIRAMSLTASGYARCLGRDDPNGLAELKAAIADIEDSGTRLSMSVNYACLAEVLALAAMQAEARRFVALAQERVDAGDRIGEVQALRSLGIAEACQGSHRLDRARMYFEDGIEIAEARGSAREAAITRWRLAEALAAAGCRDDAHVALESSILAFGAFDMPWYGERAGALAARLTASTDGQGIVGR